MFILFNYLLAKICKFPFMLLDISADFLFVCFVFLNKCDCKNVILCIIF